LLNRSFGTEDGKLAMALNARCAARCYEACGVKMAMMLVLPTGQQRSTTVPCSKRRQGSKNRGQKTIKTEETLHRYHCSRSRSCRKSSLYLSSKRTGSKMTHSCLSERTHTIDSTISSYPVVRRNTVPDTGHHWIMSLPQLPRELAAWWTAQPVGARATTSTPQAAVCKTRE
jgi:hypothetical protein